MLGAHPSRSRSLRDADRIVAGEGPTTREFLCRVVRCEACGDAVVSVFSPGSSNGYARQPIESIQDDILVLTVGTAPEALADITARLRESRCRCGGRVVWENVDDLGGRHRAEAAEWDA